MNLPVMTTDSTLSVVIVALNDFVVEPVWFVEKGDAYISSNLKLRLKFGHSRNLDTLDILK
jgi:hypothetical protein